MISRLLIFPVLVVLLVIVAGSHRKKGFTNCQMDEVENKYTVYNGYSDNIYKCNLDYPDFLRTLIRVGCSTDRIIEFTVINIILQIYIQSSLFLGLFVHKVIYVLITYNFRHCF